MDFVVSPKSCSKEACLILFNPVALQHTVPLLFHPHPTAPSMHTVHLTSCGTVRANLSHSDRNNFMFPLILTLASLQSVILSFSFSLFFFSFSFLSAILLEYNIHSIYFVHCYCSTAQLCPTLCDLMDGSRPGLPVLNHHPELAQTHVH